MRRPDAPGRFTAGGSGSDVAGDAEPTDDRHRFPREGTDCGEPLRAPERGPVHGTTARPVRVGPDPRTGGSPAPDVVERHRVGGQGIIGLTGHRLPGAVVARHGDRVAGEHTVAACVFHAKDAGAEVHVAPPVVGLLVGVRQTPAEPRRVRSGPQAVGPVVAEVPVAARAVHDAQGPGPGRAFVDVRRVGVVQGRHPQETGGAGRFGPTPVERSLADVADDLGAVRVVNHDRQPDRALGTGPAAVEVVVAVGAVLPVPVPRTQRECGGRATGRRGAGRGARASGRARP